MTIPWLMRAFTVSPSPWFHSNVFACAAGAS